jgi:hypothetical protein
MTTDAARVDHDLASLRRWITRLRAVAAAWDAPDLDVREREAFPVEWGNIIGRLAKVEAYERRGALRPSSVAELRQVAQELTELLPTMRRLGLRLPDLDALARARSVEAA